MTINKFFGKKVYEKRKLLMLSQEQLANLANNDRTYLPSIEKGERNISLQIASQIAQALQTTVDELLRGYENE